MRALTEQVYVDESEPNEEALTDLLDENHFHSKPKPGTSVRLGTSDMSPAIRFVDMKKSNLMNIVGQTRDSAIQLLLSKIISQDFLSDNVPYFSMKK